MSQPTPDGTTTVQLDGGDFVEEDDPLVEEVSIDGMCGVY
jgi:mycofactocin precursor